MSFISANDHPNPDSPDDPLYYAPRSVRTMADPRSNATRQTRSDHLPPAPPLSRFDEMREEAFAKFSQSEGVPVFLRTPSTTLTARHRGRNCRSDRCHRDRGARFV